MLQHLPPYNKLCYLKETSEQLRRTEGSGDSTKIKGKASIQGAVALILKGKADLEIEKDRDSKLEDKYEEIEFNLELPDDVADLITRVGNKKVVILENFHYLPENLQRAFSYDLRTFQDLKIRFIILGIWKEANRLSQYNGELQDRITEVPVEPWSDDDFKAITKKGENFLNISFDKDIILECISNSFGSVGVFQELLKTTCQECEITRRTSENRRVDDTAALARAIARKTEEYSGRHLRNLEAIASGNGSVILKDAPLPYFLQYYIVMHILDIGYEGLNGGISKEALMHAIKQVHHRKDDLKGPQLTAVLKGLTEVQSGKGIRHDGRAPPAVTAHPRYRGLRTEVCRATYGRTGRPSQSRRWAMDERINF
ncbi:MAG: hypothetical protein JOY60_16100, partial [Burkholderiaceae bacterium]|nr:hypothetical protein [Burkholderiaceae bacterium]